MHEYSTSISLDAEPHMLPPCGVQMQVPGGTNGSAKHWNFGLSSQRYLPFVLLLNFKHKKKPATLPGSLYTAWSSISDSKYFIAKET
jgi:hypothetical protein